MRYLLRLSVIAIATYASIASATDYVLVGSDNYKLLQDNDTVTINDHFGEDNNTRIHLLRLRGDNLDIAVNGALQGRTTLIFNRQDIDNLTVSVAEGAYVVAMM